MVQTLFDRLLPRAQAGETGRADTLEALLEANGFDRVQHEQIRADLQRGRIGLAQNRLPATSRIEDVRAGRIVDRPASIATLGTGRRWPKARSPWSRSRPAPAAAGRKGRAWSRRCIPFCKLGGRHRTFSKSIWPRAGASAANAARRCRTSSPPATSRTSRSSSISPREANYGYAGPLLLSPGRIIGLRLVPMVRDLRFAWEEMPQQMLDEQAAESPRQPARRADRLGRAGGRRQRLHRQPAAAMPASGRPLVRSARTSCATACSLRLLAERPQLKYLLLHNIDTLGA